jgi:hypothetical protein
MTQSNPARVTETPRVRDFVDLARRYLLSRRGLYILAGLIVAAGIAFGWSWLVAVGIAPLLLSGLPCIAMCALGLCMRGMGGRSCSKNANVSHARDTATGRDANDAGQVLPKPALKEE